MESVLHIKAAELDSLIIYDCCCDVCFSPWTHSGDYSHHNVHIYCLLYRSVQSELNYLKPFRDKASLKGFFFVPLLLQKPNHY